MLARIKIYIDYKGISISAFEKSIGMSNASYGKSLKSGGTIGADKIENILKTYNDINPVWLLTGSGEMLKPDIPLARHAKGYEGIPLIPINAMAGFSSGESQVLECECERYVVPMFREAEFLIQVRGSSMYPKYNSGDVVACKKLAIQDIFFQWNKVYVLDTAQGALIKRLKPGRDKDHVIAWSDNEKYDPFELSKSQVNSIAIVIGVIRLE